MAKIIWLASYPKSGNTWMRALLTNYLRDASTPADINQFDGGPIASARVWFDEWVGVEASALDDSTVATLRPAVYRCLSLQGVARQGLAPEASDTLYMKVHDAWRRTRNGEALFPSDVTAGVVYLLRNPLDLAASCAHHWGVSVDRAVENLCNPVFATGRSREGLSDQLPQQLGSWSGHARSWLEESHLPCHRVRYEDLCRDPEAVFAGVVRFCGLPFDTTRLRQAVAFSNFYELRRQEQAVGFRERPARSSAPFFRSGKAGSWREELPSHLAGRLLQEFGDAMGRCGYLDANPRRPVERPAAQVSGLL